jgi:Transposase zinc-binding domain
VNEHRLEVADIFRQHGEEFLNQWGHTVSSQQRKTLRDIAICRTATLGGHVEQCDACGHRLIAYNSCRNRHCPECQSAARDRWLAERARELLPVPYCHVVFTVPERLARLALQNQSVFYGLLFRAVSKTLLEIAADPRRLGARIGFLAVLHTWSQSLMFHPVRSRYSNSLTQMALALSSQ